MNLSEKGLEAARDAVGKYCRCPMPSLCDCTERADDAITAYLQAAGSADALTASEAARVKAEGEVERLRAALEPFAKHVDEMRFDMDNNGNPLPDDQTVGWVYVTNGDFRAARAALRREP